MKLLVYQNDPRWKFIIKSLYEILYIISFRITELYQWGAFAGSAAGKSVLRYLIRGNLPNTMKFHFFFFKKGYRFMIR